MLSMKPSRDVKQGTSGGIRPSYCGSKVNCCCTRASTVPLLPPSSTSRRHSQVARSQGALFWELRTAISLARLRANQDRPDDAHQVLASAYGKFSEGL